MTPSRIHRIAILGSTGSIGTQALDIVRRHPDLFKAEVLTAGKNHSLLARQAREFRPSVVVIADEVAYLPLKEELSDLDIEIRVGSRAIAEVATLPDVDTVLTAMVGYSGLIPTTEAIKAGKRIALSNKETLVVGGELIESLLKENPSASILPVDSEHSAIFQSLVGEDMSSVRRLILTASGGPFRTLPAEKIKDVTLEQTLRHPNWQMGPKVTVDSATMMNKGFEMIEARWLFNMPPDRIDILVHPQSVVHSLVEFIDGSVKAQLGIPDMRLPIQYALGYPNRLTSSLPSLDLTSYSGLTFEAPDMEKFPLLKVAYHSAAEGGLTPCVMNAANEVAVAAFLNSKIPFTGIYEVVAATLSAYSPSGEVTVENLQHCHEKATDIALSLIK